MKTLMITFLLSTLAAPVLATEAADFPALSRVPADGTIPTDDAFDRRSGRCVSREGSACGGV